VTLNEDEIMSIVHRNEKISVKHEHPVLDIAANDDVILVPVVEQTSIPKKKDDMQPPVDGPKCKPGFHGHNCAPKPKPTPKPKPSGHGHNHGRRN